MLKSKFAGLFALIALTLTAAAPSVRAFPMTSLEGDVYAFGRMGLGSFSKVDEQTQSLADSLSPSANINMTHDASETYTNASASVAVTQNTHTLALTGSSLASSYASRDTHSAYSRATLDLAAVFTLSKETFTLSYELQAISDNMHTSMGSNFPTWARLSVRNITQEETLAYISVHHALQTHDTGLLELTGTIGDSVMVSLEFFTNSGTAVYAAIDPTQPAGGSTFADVTVMIPEPTSAVSLLPLAGLLMRRRRAA